MYKKLAELLEQKGLTAAQVTKDTGLVSNAFSEWKKGKAKPSLDSIKKLADYFGVTIEYFLDDGDGA